MSKEALVQIDKPGALMAIPDYLKGVHGREGSENVTKDDLVIPRLALCQSMHPERKKSSPKYIPGLEEGQFFNTSNQDVYGNTVQVIPLLKTSSRIYFQDMKQGGGILCRSMNGVDGGTIVPTCASCPNSQGYPSACTEFKNILSVLLPSRTVILVSMKSTALKAAKQWISRMQDLTEKLNKPFYTNVFEITTAADKNMKGEYFVPVVKRVGWADEGDFRFAEAKYSELKGMAVKIHESVEAGEVAQEVSDQDIPF